MALFLATAPTVHPITRDEAKLHLRVDHSADDDLIDTLIAAAVGHVENGTHRKMITQTWDDKRDGFPCGDELWLPYPPVSSVSSISYVDTNGATQTWSSSEYTTDLPTGPHARMARIVPAYGYSWPSTRSVINSVTVRFVCGYGAAGSYVPGALLAAMKLLIEHWYANRGVVAVGAISTELQMGVQSLIWQYKAI